MQFSISVRLIITGLCVVLLALMFGVGIERMAAGWSFSGRYWQGPLAPVAALGLLYLRLPELRALDGRGSWAGPVFTALGVFMALAGELSALYVLIQLALLVAVAGVLVSLWGWRVISVAWMALACLIFLIPLPTFLENPFFGSLEIPVGVTVAKALQMAGVTVLFQGNELEFAGFSVTIDVAVDGLRHFLALCLLGLVLVAIPKGRVLRRCVLLVAAPLIAIMLAWLRVFAMGLLAAGRETGAAQSMLDGFGHWWMFVIGAALLFGLAGWMRLLPWQGETAGGVSSAVRLSGSSSPSGIPAPLLGTVAVLAAGVLLSAGVHARQELIPERRSPLAMFPSRLGEWSGSSKYVDPRQLKAVKVDDHLMRDYTMHDGSERVELWIAYYDTQRKGQSVHSPRSCLPGQGWQIESLQRMDLSSEIGLSHALPVNRVVMAKGASRALVYYWFVERGKPIANEYLAKWSIFWDALTRSRTDGALVRVTTVVSDISRIEEADARLQAFIEAADPQLAYFLPRTDATFVNDGRSSDR